MGPDPKDPDYIQAKIADSKVTLRGTDTIQLCDAIDILEGIQKVNGRIPDVTDAIAMLRARLKELKATGCGVREFRDGGGKLSAKFCRCIKKVRKTVRVRKGSTREQAAIGICVKSVLHSRGKTVKKFSCGKKARLVTQKKGGCPCMWK